MIAIALRRELRILVRARGSVINPLAFLLLSTLLFVIAAPGLVEDDPDRPSTLPAGILWTLVLLAQLLALSKPLALVLFHGGMLTIPPSLLQAPNLAIVSAGYPGIHGGVAIADALFDVPALAAEQVRWRQPGGASAPGPAAVAAAATAAAAQPASSGR